MQRLEEFRQYYNHTIHPELVRLEKRRTRLILMLSLSGLLVLGLFFVQSYLHLFVVTMVLMVPVGFYMAYLFYRFQQFNADFKPLVVNHIIDFVDDSINFGQMKYDAKGSISKEVFNKSQIFVTPAPVFQGEDKIVGKIGELNFEMCELRVQDFSRVKNRLNKVFEGVFLHSRLNRNARGSVLIVPERYKPVMVRSLKSFNYKGGVQVDHQMSNQEFDDVFAIYATPDCPIQSLLSPAMQAAILDYHLKTKKDIFLSVIGGEIFVAVSEPKDILEPHWFKSNVSYELVREFFEDISLLISIVEDFDIYN